MRKGCVAKGNPWVHDREKFEWSSYVEKRLSSELGVPIYGVVSRNYYKL